MKLDIESKFSEIAVFVKKSLWFLRCYNIHNTFADSDVYTLCSWYQLYYTHNLGFIEIIR